MLSTLNLQKKISNPTITASEENVPVYTKQMTYAAYKTDVVLSHYIIALEEI